MKTIFTGMSAYPKMNNLLQDPTPDVGSLATDISFLNAVVEEDYDQQYLDTLRIAAVLRALYLKIDKEGLPEPGLSR